MATRTIIVQTILPKVRGAGAGCGDGRNSTRADRGRPRDGAGCAVDCGGNSSCGGGTACDRPVCGGASSKGGSRISSSKGG
ncbi:MAG: hypothetical protein WC610_00090 [Patescibacteria group bacterium]